MSKTWREFLEKEQRKQYYACELKPFVEGEYAAHTVYPEHKNILRALALTPLSEVKVVILGQDPYHEPSQANGLAFSVADGVPLPPSLKNIYEEISTEYGCSMPETGNLEPWARQGVLLLNTVLTVREHEANSHAGYGWERFTDAVLKELDYQDHPIAFILWGASAQKKAANIINPIHCILKTSHPSPLSVYRGFRGSGIFKKCDEFLMANGIAPVDWTFSV